MRYCPNCGEKLSEKYSFCPNCGSHIVTDIQSEPSPFEDIEELEEEVNIGAKSRQSASRVRKGAEQSGSTAIKPNLMQTIAKVFMIIGCIAYGWTLIPLCWTIPMTVSYFKHVNSGVPVSVGFKVCSLLFVNLIAGILMLCDDFSVEDL